MDGVWWHMALKRKRQVGLWVPDQSQFKELLPSIYKVLSLKTSTEKKKKAEILFKG